MELSRATITKFFPYEAVFILGVFLRTDTKEEYEAFKKEFNYMLGVLNGIGIFKYKNPVFHGFKEGYFNLQWDNKVTFEVLHNNLKLYYQFYDGKVSIGTGIRERNFNPETHYVEFK